MKLLLRIFLSIQILAGCMPGSELPPAPLTLEEVLRAMGEHDRLRSSKLTEYSCLRRYTLNNRRFHKTAEITARMTYNSPGRKTFEILTERGPSVIRERVLRRMIDAEKEASSDELRLESQISPRNYDFQLLGADLRHGRNSYVLAVTPKTRSKFLVRGKIWVDAEDFAVVRVEGAPAQNPSAWIRNTAIVQQSKNFAPFWFPLSNHSETDSFLFGRTEVTIEYSDYRITQNAPENSQPSGNSDR
jgi:hypothetical protein